MQKQLTAARAIQILMRTKNVISLHPIWLTAIYEPTHSRANCPVCFDLTFTCQPNLVMESGAHSSLHASCHHQVVFTKFNVQFCYLPP